MESIHYGGEWHMFDCMSEDGTCHIAPNFGREHELDEDCWCHPEPSSACERIIVHNVEH